jgi:SAM-dependent methyltransferase
MRVYDETIDLDYTATRRFFEQRGEKISTVGALGAVLYQDRQPDLARRRSDHEIRTIAPRLRAAGSLQNILDLGCGTGRWTAAMADFTQQYIGLDFCEDFLNEASRAAASLPAPARFRYEHADLSQGLPDSVSHTQFHTVIVAGVLLYLNDADASALLVQIADRMAPGALLYIREPLGLSNRLTLKEHFSTDLDASYSSVYRAISEFETMLNDTTQRHGLVRQESGPLYPAELDNRTDTRQFYFLLRKTSP